MPSDSPEYVIVGGLREDYVISHTGETHLRVIGGNAIYAGVGARLWSDKVGLVSRVGRNYPADWLAELERRGFDGRGVVRLDTDLDIRTFYAYLSLEERVDTDPASHFMRLGRPTPRELIDYGDSTRGQENRAAFTPAGVRASDIPADFHEVKGYHLAPHEFMTHRMLPEALRRAGVRLITCDPSARYMQPSFAGDVRQLVSGFDAFLPSEMEVRSFFRDTFEDYWQAAEALAQMGTLIVAIKLGARGQYVYDRESRARWHVPAYPANVRDVTGAGDAYCGGFLVGLAETGDPVEASLRGAVSASLVVEGQGALYALDAMPRLAAARLDSLRQAVRRL